MKVETVPLTSVKPYFRNPRTNDDTVRALIKSIERYGFNVPIVVDKNNVIVTGHARYKALLKMGKATAEIIRATDLTEDEARRYRIEDNITQEIATWENDTLLEEIKGINTWDDAIEMFDGTLDNVLDSLVKVELPDLNVDEVFEEAPEGNQEEEIEKQEIEYQDNDDEYIICPYCGEYNSKEDLKNSIEE